MTNTAGSTARDEDESYRFPTPFEEETKEWVIGRHRRVYAPQFEIKDTVRDAAQLVPELVKKTEQYRLERIAHMMLRNGAQPKDRIRAIILLLESFDTLDVDMATKTINMANRMIGMTTVEDADKVRIASLLRKLVLKPTSKDKGHGTYEELKLKKVGQYVIEVDDE